MEREYIESANLLTFFLTVCIHFTQSKEASHLGQKWKKGVPIEVIPMSYKPIQKKIEAKYGGEAVLRMSADKAVSRRTNNQ